MIVQDLSSPSPDNPSDIQSSFVQNFKPVYLEIMNMKGFFILYEWLIKLFLNSLTSPKNVTPLFHLSYNHCAKGNELVIPCSESYCTGDCEQDIAAS